jgi:two-component system, sensor histidine kinase and response regulator
MVCAAIAAADLAGWLASVQVFGRLLPSGPVMKANTALVLLLVCGSAYTARRAAGGWNRWRAAAVTLVVLTAGVVGATAFEHVSGRSLGIDQLIAGDPSATHGRIAVGTIGYLVLLLAGILGLEASWRGFRPSEWIAAVVAVFAVLALIGDIFGVQEVAGLAGASQIAASTAGALLLLSVSLVAASPRHVIYRAAAGPDAGARFVRRVGLAGVLVPFAFGLAVDEAGRSGAFGLDFALSLGTFIAMAAGLAGVIIASEFVRRAERAALGRREAEVFKMMVETASEGIWTTDSLGRTLFMNERMLQMLGYEAGELIGRRALDLCPPELRDRQNARMQDRLWGRAESYETPFVRKDGSILWARVGATPRLGADGRPAGSLGLVSDLTAQRAVEEALKAARSEAVEASNLKSEFLANMSHEIRTPMNGVLGMTELLRGTTLDEEQAAYADAITRSGDALMTIINDILDFSKIEAGKLDLEEVDFDLRLVVEEAAALMAQRAQAKGVELAVMIEPAVPDWVCGDPARLRQVLINLVGNAAKFTERGEVVLRVRSGPSVRFEVSDTGPGITEAVQKQLFQSFTQGDASTNRKHGGTGLGLAISRQLVMLMGGAIGVRSEPGRGSTFFFDCPFKPSPTVIRAPAGLASTLGGLRGLVIDDNETSRTILEQTLRVWRLEVASCDRGSRALELLATAAAAATPFDFVLLDHQMPGLDGVEVARRIRADPSMGGPRLILLTSTAQPGVAQAARAAGVDALLAKPVKLALLRECLATVMGRAPASAPATVTVETMAEAHAAHRPLVLIVDDNPVNQKVSAAMLGKLGFRTDVAHNGIEAVAVTAARNYAAVLMDCYLPEMDGYEATGAIRLREGAGRHTPIIAMTASAMKGDMERCLAAGMDAYVSKPVRMKDLGAVIAHWIATRETPPPLPVAEILTGPR